MKLSLWEMKRHNWVPQRSSLLAQTPLLQLQIVGTPLRVPSSQGSDERSVTTKSEGHLNLSFSYTSHKHTGEGSWWSQELATSWSCVSLCSLWAGWRGSGVRGTDTPIQISCSSLSYILSFHPSHLQHFLWVVSKIMEIGGVTLPNKVSSKSPCNCFS